MDWDKEIEINGNVAVSVGELHSILLVSLTKDEMEEFAGEIIKASILDEERFNE
jgi:hypothetical protein